MCRKGRNKERNIARQRPEIKDNAILVRNLIKCNTTHIESLVRLKNDSKNCVLMII